jgi:IS1 family transposase/lambda repressor-like predicted transcriptional regulator
MNRLSTEKRAEILGMLVEGNSLRATTRMAGVSINTVSKLLTDIGAACAEYQDEVLRDLPCTTVQVDEIWSFCYSKQKNVPEKHKGEYGYGDVWTWTALCADTKLVPSWLVGERKYEQARAIMDDLRSRLANRVQLTTDGHSVYVAAVGLAFKGQPIDWAQIQKIYKSDPSGERRYSPPVCTGTYVRVLKGEPDPDKISTSYVERQNLTMRMHMRRFTRLTNAFSKKVENHAAAVALHFMAYNFARPHQSLLQPNENGPATKRTPAMAAGVADHIWTLTEIAELLD